MVTQAVAMPSVLAEIGECFASAGISRQVLVMLLAVFWIAILGISFLSRQYRFSGRSYFSLANAAILYWLLVACLEYWMVTPKCKSLMGAFAWPGIMAASLGFLGFVGRFTLGLSTSKHSGIEYAIGIAAAVLFCLLLTNDHHALFLIVGTTSSGEVSPDAVYRAGPLMVLTAALCQLMVTGATGVMLGGMMIGNRFTRLHLLALGPLSLLPPLAGLYTLTVGKGVIGFDPTPWIAAATAAAYWADLRVWHMLELNVVAQEKMFDTHSDAILVLSATGSLKHRNRKAEELLGMHADDQPKGASWLRGALQELRFRPVERQSYTMSNGGLTFKFEAQPLVAKLLAAEVHLGWIVFVESNDWAVKETSRLSAELAQQASELSSAVRARKDAEVAALRDPLTGLLNLRALDTITMKIARAHEIHQQYIVSLIDLNDFKAINDTYGHAIGDRVLQTFANALRVSFRKGDLVFRVGGDEFLVLAKGIQRDDFTHAMAFLDERLRANLEASDLPDDVSVSFSSGFAHWSPETLSFDDARHAADLKLYRAKRTIAGGALRARRNRLAGPKSYP